MHCNMVARRIAVSPNSKEGPGFDPQVRRPFVWSFWLYFLPKSRWVLKTYSSSELVNMTVFNITL